MASVQRPLRIPLWSVNPQFDNDDPTYVPGDPGTYLLLALCYDSMAGPSVRRDLNGVGSPDFLAMKPRLAEAFGENGDGSWWVRLKRGLRSQWGNELTAETVQWGLKKAFALGNIAAWRWGQVAGVQDITNVEILDKYTLSYTLRRPNPYLASFLFSATPNVFDATEVIRHATEKDPWGMVWLSRNVAGFGPFALGDFQRGRMVLHARKEYWAGEPPVKEDEVDEVGSRSEAISLLDRPSPVFLASLRCDEVRQVQGKPNIRLTGSWAGHTTVEINYHTPPFDDRRVRHALSLATPYQEVLDEGFLGLARPWKSPLKTFTPWYTERFWHYDTNMTKAKALLAKAGYVGGFTTQLYTPPRADMIRVAHILKNAYGRIGVKLEIEDLGSVPKGWMPPLHLRPDCGHNITEPLYDLAHDYAPFDPIFPGPRGAIGVATWRPRYVGDPVLEEMYRETLLAEDKETRRKRCVALQRAIVEFAPCIFIGENSLFAASNVLAHPWMADYDNRLLQVTLFQNANSNYLAI